MNTITPQQAVHAIAGRRGIIPAPGCGTPTTLLRAIGQHADELGGRTPLYSGLLLGAYEFVEAVREGRLKYVTWHVMPPVRKLVAEGVVDFVPVRGSQVPRMLRTLGIDVLLLRVSPPDRFGFCSTGPSGSFPLMHLEHADLVIAEVDPRLPRTRGQASVHESRIDLCVESEDETPLFEGSGAPDEVSRRIAEHLLPLLPENPTLQIGIGSIPEALLDELHAAGAGGLRFVGMATDQMVDLHDAGLLDVKDLWPTPPILAAELMGSRKLLDFAHENPLLGVFDTDVGINASLGRIDRLVSIHSAIEVDHHGQVNSEWVKGAQLTGCGGSIDFLEAAIASEGGVRVIAMPAQNVRSATSKIVPELEPGAPVTIARHSVDYVVTEYGVARLGYASVRERVEALKAIAGPAASDPGELAA
jgi:4-hydroxybutyrate CoA-transferase